MYIPTLKNTQLRFFSIFILVYSRSIMSHEESSDLTDFKRKINVWNDRSMRAIKYKISNILSEYTLQSYTDASCLVGLLLHFRRIKDADDSSARKHVLRRGSVRHHTGRSPGNDRGHHCYEKDGDKRIRVWRHFNR